MPRNPTGSLYPNLEFNQLDPEEYMRLRENPNTKKNTESNVSTYNRVMQKYEQESGQQWVNLDDAPRAQLPDLLSKFLQITTRVNGTV